MLKEYLVRDELNSEEGEGKVIESWSPSEAALEYAENDQDGLADGIYGGSQTQPLIVQEIATSRRWRVEVGYVMEWVLKAEEDPELLEETP